jgi:hypothetical protein
LQGRLFGSALTEPEAIVELTNSFYQLAMASLLGLGTTSSSMLEAAIGLYVPFSKRPLTCLLAFAAGSLIFALAIELAFEGAQSLHAQGFNVHAAWAFVSAGLAAGAIVDYSASLFLEKKGAVVRYVTQFRKYALARKQGNAKERIRLLASCDLMRHLPAEQIERILPCVHDRPLKTGEVLFKAGEPGDALYIVAHAGVVAAAAGKAFIGGSDALSAIFAQALAGGAVLALVAHAMIPVALEEGGSLVVLPTVVGFLFALYLALAESFV